MWNIVQYFTCLNQNCFILNQTLQITHFAISIYNHEPSTCSVQNQRQSLRFITILPCLELNKNKITKCTYLCFKERFFKNYLFIDRFIYWLTFTSDLPVKRRGLKHVFRSWILEIPKVFMYFITTTPYLRLKKNKIIKYLSSNVLLHFFRPNINSCVEHETYPR